ncbi:hypothetical protein [Janthinobacterium sp. RB2R34]|uniref:hypothetical protein n=1 Tax=Janthinobacterium sp. RB2R34 TaxID=3424193 RepID=UPI003F1FCAE2
MRSTAILSLLPAIMLMTSLNAAGQPSGGAPSAQRPSTPMAEKSMMEIWQRQRLKPAEPVASAVLVAPPVDELKKSELKDLAEKIRQACPSCSTVISIGGATIVGGNVGASSFGSAVAGSARKCVSADKSECNGTCLMISDDLYQLLLARTRKR